MRVCMSGSERERWLQRFPEPPELQTSMCFCINKTFGPFSLHDGVDDWWRRESLLNEERLGAHGRENCLMYGLDSLLPPT